MWCLFVIVVRCKFGVVLLLHLTKTCATWSIFCDFLASCNLSSLSGLCEVFHQESVQPYKLLRELLQDNILVFVLQKIHCSSFQIEQNSSRSGLSKNARNKTSYIPHMLKSESLGSMIYRTRSYTEHFFLDLLKSTGQTTCSSSCAHTTQLQGSVKQSLKSSAAGTGRLVQSFLLRQVNWTQRYFQKNNLSYINISANHAVSQRTCNCYSWTVCL